MSERIYRVLAIYLIFLVNLSGGSGIRYGHMLEYLHLHLRIRVGDLSSNLLVLFHVRFSETELL